MFRRYKINAKYKRIVLMNKKKLIMGFMQKFNLTKPTLKLGSNSVSCCVRGSAILNPRSSYKYFSTVRRTSTL